MPPDANPREVVALPTAAEQHERAQATLAIYCQNCGALPGERCATRSGKPCQRRKLAARAAVARATEG